MSALLIAHRGASGYLPEHTLAAYELAIEQGADCIEPDVVMTRDGVLIARHENEIGGTTDVAAHAEFSARRRTQSIDGRAVTGWFTEDFTLAEIKSLRARERLPELRAASHARDGLYTVPTLAEILQLVAEANAKRGSNPVGVYPEIKHPSHFAALGLAMEQPLLALLQAQAGAAPVYIQSFETGNLRELAKRCSYPLVQLVDLAGGPWDRRSEGIDYDALCTPAGLAQVAEYAAVLGVHKERLLPRDSRGRLGEPMSLVDAAHRAGLKVHPWTFRAENYFLPTELRRGATPGAHGDLRAEIERHLALGIDGFFCDFPDIGRKALLRT
jgi:glycerophosphoryl diester phosphodiesterase